MNVHITIIIATFNEETTLSQCLESIVRQTYQKIQIIIIDGASTDHTIDIIKHYENSISYWCSEPDHGIYHAWNKGLVHAEGNWVCFLGADDYFWSPNVLEQYARQLQIVSTKVGLVYAKVMLLDNSGEPMYTLGQPWDQIKSRMNALMSLPHPAVMYRKELFKKMGTFSQHYKIAGDYDLLLRVLPYFDVIFIDNLISVGMRQGGISSSASNIAHALKEVRHAQKKHGYLWPKPRWIIAMLTTYLRIFFYQCIGTNRTHRLLDFIRQKIGKDKHWTKI